MKSVLVPLKVEYLGVSAYKDALAAQEEKFNKLLERKRRDFQGNDMHEAEHYFFLCQHHPVYTLGKNGKPEHVLKSAANNDAEFFNTSRGGDITYHGPGQLVGYPILDLEALNIGLARYIELIEESIIRTIAEYGIQGERYKGASGVWLDTNDPIKIRKICAIGIRSSRWVTMHGFAFNINTDLNYFNHIVPCGIADKGVTSLQKELGAPQDFEQVMERVLFHFKSLFFPELA